jgi:hypothetical protein
MKQIFKAFYRLLVLFGIDPLKSLTSIREFPYFSRNLISLLRQKKSSIRMFALGRLYPCFGDRFSNSGTATGHYFHQDLLVARRVHSNKPILHVDIGSSVEGFVAHVASFRSIEVLDIRPLSNKIPNIKFKKADFMTPIKEELIEYCDSVSCLHALEHFGLGRYGDPVIYDGYLLGLNNLHKILKKGGKLYLSVPIGPQRIEFDAHRVFSVGYLMELFVGKYSVDHFSFVDDCGDLHESVPMAEANIHENFGCMYGCGVFEMTKM